MMHVKQIRQLIQKGEVTQAADAIDNLLILGPNNLDALKIKAEIYEQSGRFSEEAAVWQRVLDIHPEDQEAFDYLYRRQMEDKEHFHFTDRMADGGRKFMAYPKGMIASCIYGMVGIVLFLVLARLSTVFQILQSPIFASTVLLLCIIGPIGFFFYQLLNSLNYMIINAEGVSVHTRLKKSFLKWDEIESISLSQVLDKNLYQSLHLFVIPSGSASSSIQISLDTYDATIRARSYLLKDISRFKQITYDMDFASLNIDSKNHQSF